MLVLWLKVFLDRMPQDFVILATPYPHTTADYVDKVFGGKSLWPTNPYEKAQEELLVDGFGNQVCAYRQFLLHSVSRQPPTQTSTLALPHLSMMTPVKFSRTGLKPAVLVTIVLPTLYMQTTLYGSTVTTRQCEVNSLFMTVFQPRLLCLLSHGSSLLISTSSTGQTRW